MEPIKVADAVWIAAAQLQQERGREADFTVKEVIERACRDKSLAGTRPGIRAHAVAHAVADRPPNPGNYRMLHTTGRGRRRLFRSGDPVHEGRTGKIHPHPNDIPERYRPLIDWYRREYDSELPKLPEPPVGKVNGPVFLRFWGIMSQQRAKIFEKVVEEACERIEP